MPSRPKVLYMAPWLPDEARQILESACDADYLDYDRQRLLDVIPNYDALWSHFDYKVDKEILSRGKRLKAVATATTGTDHIDKEQCARQGIRVLCTARDIGLLDTFTATAELSWLLLLACHRNFRAASRAAHAGQWHHSERMQGDQLSKRTLGVLGLGRLGKMVAEFAKAFRMRVLGCDTRPIEIPGVTKVDFDTLLRESDAISIHIHMTPDNHQLFNSNVLGRMKRGAILMNTSRGDLIDEQALLSALQSGQLSAFGADVLHDEWRTDMSTQPIVQYAKDHDNVVLMPHVGGAVRQTIANSRIFSARKLVHFLQTGNELQWPEGRENPQ